MSGILCAWDPDEAIPARTVEAALAEMDYRGPDGSRLVAVDDVHLGHQRFDVTPTAAAGEQPVRDGDVWLVLDGRVDNRRALAASLPGADAGDPDAALLAAAYREHGPSFVEHVVGAFGVVVYDGAAGRLVVARDRVGRREVLYGRAGGATVVASDRTPVLRCRGAAGREAGGGAGEAVEERRLAEYLTFHTFTPGLTVYEGVRALPPGHYAVVERDGAVEPRRYWRPGGSVLRAPAAELRGQLAEHARATVAASLRAAGPVGAELSGGMDSTTVVALAAGLLDGEVDAGSPGAVPSDLDRGDLAGFSLVFGELGGEGLRREERRRIADVAADNDLVHREVVADDLWPRPDAGVYDRAPLEGVCRNATAVAFEGLYEGVAGDGRRVLLSGEGGNFFDGAQSAYADLVHQGRLLAAARGMLADDSPTWRVGWLVALRLAQSVGGRYPGTRQFDHDAVLSDELRAVAERPRQQWPAYPQAHYDRVVTRTADRRLFHSHYLELLAFDRRVALAAGVDLRYPLLDPRLVDLAYSLPVEHLYRAGERKHLFRRFAARHLPESVHRETGTPSFTPLVARGLAECREQVTASLRTGRLVARGHVPADDVDEVLAAAYRRGVEDRSAPSTAESDLWRLLCAERWLRDATDAGVLEAADGPE